MFNTYFMMKSYFSGPDLFLNPRTTAQNMSWRQGPVAALAALANFTQFVTAFMILDIWINLPSSCSDVLESDEYEIWLWLQVHSIILTVVLSIAGCCVGCIFCIGICALCA